MQKQIKDLKAAAESRGGGTKRKAEEEEEEEEEEEGEDNTGRSSSAKKTTTLVNSDDSDDDVQCVMIEKNISKEAEIKEALRMMIIKPTKVDLEKKIISEQDSEEKIVPESDSEEKVISELDVKVQVKCPVEKEAILNLDEVKLKANSDQHKTVGIDHRDIDESVNAKESTIDSDTTDTIDLEANTEESNSAREMTEEIGNNVNPMECKSGEEATKVLEEKDIDLEMSWQLKKWPSLPSLLNRLRCKKSRFLEQNINATNFAGKKVSIFPFLFGLQTPDFKISSTYPLLLPQGGYLTIMMVIMMIAIMRMKASNATQKTTIDSLI